MKLRNQILSLGLMGVVTAALVGGIGLLNTIRLSQAIEDAVNMGVALQSSQEADMMHDAIRADVLLALFGSLRSDTAQIAEAKKGLAEHTENFNQSLGVLQALPISSEIKSIVDNTLPLVKKYTDAAEKVLTLASTDAAAAQAQVDEFQKVFGELERQMSEQSDAIEQRGQAINGSAADKVRMAKIEVTLALVFSAIVIVLFSLWLARRMAQPMAHAVHIADQLAQGDLSVPIIAVGNAETLQLLNAMARMQTSFGGIVASVKTSAASVATASAEIADGNNDLSARTEQQASSLEETASSMEELGSTVQQNADHARHANELALTASSVAVDCGNVVSQAVQTMRGINDASRKIADIIQVIDGIAFQTNILALNAAVEAARAGEQGRGFAVVATEVRALAGRSAGAAKEIKHLIDASVQRVAQGTALVDQAGGTMEQVVSSIQRLTHIMGEISAASSDQNAGLTQVNEAVRHMDHVTQQNAALVEQMAAAASSLKNQSSELVSAMSVFRLQS